MSSNNTIDKDLSYIAGLSRTTSDKSSDDPITNAESKVNMNEFADVLDMSASDTEIDSVHDNDAMNSSIDDAFDFGEKLLDIHEERSIDLLPLMKKIADVYKKVRESPEHINIIATGSGPIKDMTFNDGEIRFIV
jgi:hypothetical protein